MERLHEARPETPAERPRAPEPAPPARRIPMTPAAVLALQRGGGNAATARVLRAQRQATLAREEAPAAPEAAAPAQAAPEEAAPATGPANRQELEGIRDKAARRNAALGEFVISSRADIGRLRDYYTALDGVYSGAYGRYAGQVNVARAGARDRQQIASLLYGAATAIAITAFAEAVVPATAFATISAGLRPILMNVGPNAASSAVSTFATPTVAPGGDIQPAAALQPALRQNQALQEVDRLSSLVLSLAAPAPAAFLATAVGAERLIGNERGAKPEPGADDAALLGQLRQADAIGAQLEPVLAELRQRFADIRSLAGRSAPDAVRVEHDIWISWIASIDDFEVLANGDLERYFKSIGLDSRLGVEGAMDRIPFLDPRGWHSDARMHSAAQQQMTDVGVRWEHYLLLDPYGGG